MNILFVVAHPDDEALGGGAFIFKRSCRGDEVSVLTLSAHSPTRPDSLKKEQAESHAIMGVARTYNANYETMKFGTYDRYEMVRGIEDVIKETEPDIIVTHNPYDVHPEPAHHAMGGLADEFDEWERRHGVTLELLRYFDRIDGY